MKECYDGYNIAEKDLEMRGPGDFIASSQGARQHGAFSFKLAGLCSDTLLLDKVFKLAEETLDTVSVFDNTEYSALAKAVLNVSISNFDTKN